jgi:hypothetical protein
LSTWLAIKEAGNRFDGIELKGLIRIKLNLQSQSVRKACLNVWAAFVLS